MSNGIEIKNLPSATTIKQNDTMTIVQDRENKQLTLDRFANESDLTTLTPLEARCDEVKAKIEVDEYSAEITTSQSMSKIGSDDSGVDLHENVLDGAFESCVLKGKTKYRDIDTGEILEDFEEGRNLELITVRMPILRNVGKNLIGNLVYGNVSSQGIILDNKGKQRVRTDYIPISSTGAYRLSNHSDEIGITIIFTFDENKNLIKNRGWNASHFNSQHTFSNEEKYIIIEMAYDPASTNDVDISKIKIQFEQNIQVTTYEPYKTNILSFNQKDDKTIVLRSLPNGVCDTLNVETGEYVQRIGELVVNGDNTVSYTAISTGAEKTIRVAIAHSSIKIVSNESVICAYCNNLGYKYNYQDDKDFESFFVANSNNRIFMRLAKSKLETLDIAGVKKYFSKNPYIFQYELETPIVSTIDVQGFPHAYTNGHIQLSSGSTEPSLTPTVTYKVPVSRVGQIASNTKSNLRQTIKLDQLEILAYQSLINAEYENLLVQNSAESAASFRNLSVNNPKDELYYMLKHLIEENQPVQNMLDKINLFYLYGLLSDEHYFDLLLGGEEDVY